MKLVLALVLIAITSSLALDDVQMKTRFSAWKGFHHKSYSAAEEQRRFEIFSKNVDLITQHNLEAAAGKHSFTLATNAFADLTNDEYRQIYLGLKRRGSSSAPKPSSSSNDSIRGSADFTRLADPVPDAWDWRQHGYTIAVKDQGQCGSCWAFSATCAMEGAWFQKTGQLVSLSEQLCVDCVLNGTDTCSVGGEMHDCYLQVVQEGGDESESDYPYTAADGTCAFDKTKAVGQFSGYLNVTQFDEVALKNASAAHVISVGIDASSIWFQLYFGGVYDDSSCKSDYADLDHGVAVVGYGNDSSSGKDYWIVRNSWGASWGMAGHILMVRNKSNQCGIATDATFPITK